MASRLRSLLRRDDGQALTELGLTAGFLCLMLLAVWQVGTVFSNYIDLSEAAREGARAAALSGAPTTSGDTAVLQHRGQRRQVRRNLLGGSAAVHVDVHGPERHDRLDRRRYARGRPARRCAPRSPRPTRSASSASSVASGTMSVSDVMRVHRQGA